MSKVFLFYFVLGIIMFIFVNSLSAAITFSVGAYHLIMLRKRGVK